MLRKGYGNPYLGSGVEISILTMGKLGHLYTQYENRIKQVKSLGMQDQTTDQIRQQLV